MEKDFFEELNSIFEYKSTIESMNDSQEYQNLRTELQQINNSTNSDSDEERKIFEDRKKFIIQDLNKYDEKYQTEKKSCEIKINNLKRYIQEKITKIDERTEKLKQYQDNLKISINQEEEKLKKEMEKDFSQKNTMAIHEYSTNLNNFKETYRKLNDELIKNVKTKSKLKVYSENLSYDKLDYFSAELNKYNENKKNLEKEEKTETSTEQVIENPVEEVISINNQESALENNIEPLQITNENKNTDKSDSKKSKMHKDDKLHILVNDKGYLVEGVEEPVKINTYLLDKSKRDTIEKALYGEDYKEIKNEIDSNKVKKSYDSNLLKILYNKLGKNVAINYLRELAKGKNADKEKLPYSITYDVEKIKKNKQLETKKQTKSLLKIIKKNKYVANVIEKNKNKLKYGIVGLLAAGVGFISTASSPAKTVDNEKYTLPNNEYTDTLIPRTRFRG